MHKVRVIVVSLSDNAVLIDKTCDFDTVNGRRYIAEHAQRAMAAGDAIMTIPEDVASFSGIARAARVLSDYTSAPVA